jgi:PAS domain S-box-containing protein
MDPSRDRRQLAYYRDLYHNAPVGYLLLDAQGGIEDINRTGAAMLGWPPDWLVGKPFGRWVMRDDRALFARHLHELQEPGGRLTQELRIKTRSGWPLQVRLDSTRSAGNGSTVYRTVMVDVSTHRFAERQARLHQGGAPGTIYVIEPEPRDAAPEELTLAPHDVDPTKVLRMVRAMNGRCRRIVLVGREPETFGDEIEGRMGLSEPVMAAVDEAAHVVEGVVADLLASRPAAGDDAGGTT